VPKSAENEEDDEVSNWNHRLHSFSSLQPDLLVFLFFDRRNLISVISRKLNGRIQKTASTTKSRIAKTNCINCRIAEPTFFKLGISEGPSFYIKV
jgi:hypothetical protein